MSNERLRETVVTYTNERSLKLQSDPQRLRSIAKLEEARKDIRTKMSFDARERVSMARHRIRRMEELSKDSALESQVQELVEASERSISYQRIFELESQLFNLFRTHDSAPGRNHVDNLRAMRLQQYCDGDEELEAKVRNFSFPPNAPIDSSALYELEQEVFDLREDKLFVLRENLEEANERITTLETKIHELTEALRSHTEIVSPESLETRSLAEQQRLQQTNDDLRRQLDEAHVQLEDYKNRFSDFQKQLVEASREVQSKDLALSVAQNQLRQFEERR
ncbi:myosin heavy chain form B domain protein [Chlamydia psittaci VS225]|nr:myosin heavy chain form B domain protein [Chlamydia psittaci VS225]